jgi:hypothetical protein
MTERRDLVTRADLRRDLLVNAATKPLNVGVTAVVAVAGVLLGTVWLIAVAVIVYVALGVLTFFDQDEAERVGQRAYGRARGDEPKRVDPGKLAPPIAAQVQAARACEARIQETIARGDLPFSEVDGEVDALVRAIEAIAQRAQRVYEYLTTQDTASLDYRLAQLKSGAPQDNQAIIAALSEQRNALVKLQDQLNRFYAQNEQLVASLGTINSELVNMSVAGDESDQRELVDHVRDLHTQVDAMSEGLREAYGKTDAPALPG